MDKKAPANIRREVLVTAEHLINGDRALAYGNPEDSFGRIAKLWTAMGMRMAVPGTNGARAVSSNDVALAMNLLKVSRAVGNPDSMDSYVDGAGYMALAAELSLQKLVSPNEQ
jgi:hypothetical protein